MKRRVEDIISKCIEGNASRDIVKSLIDEAPDFHSIRTSLVRDLTRSGCKVISSKINQESSFIEVTLSSVHNKSLVEETTRTYSLVYPEVDVFIIY